LRRLADIVCLLARFSAGILEGRIYLSQLSKFRVHLIGPGRRVKVSASRAGFFVLDEAIIANLLAWAQARRGIITANEVATSLKG
jgi:hypothetical protein